MGFVERPACSGERGGGPRDGGGALLLWRGSQGPGQGEGRTGDWGEARGGGQLEGRGELGGQAGYRALLIGEVLLNDRDYQF